MAEEKAEQCDKTSSCPSDKELKGEGKKIAWMWTFQHSKIR